MKRGMVVKMKKCRRKECGEAEEKTNLIHLT
jgi:hypothetical protein